MAENKEVAELESFLGDVPPILPDGWEEGNDLIPDNPGDLDALLADGQEEDPLEALLREGNESTGAAPTTGGETGPDQADADETGTEGKPDGAQPAEARTSRKLTLKVNHHEQEIDIDAMGDEDLKALLQKGYAFDALKDAEDRRNFLAAYQEQIDAGMTEATARLVAKEAASGKVYNVVDGQIKDPVPTPAEVPDTVQQKTRNLKAELDQFRLLFKDVKQIPDDVAKAVAKGAPLVSAYLAYRDQESKKAADTLRKENKILKQN